jgi:hypothetical protein
MSQLAAIAFHLILVHTVNGDIIGINPDSITSMRDRAPQNDDDERLMVKGVECMINLNDGKFISVVEHCDEVRKLIEEADKK